MSDLVLDQATIDAWPVSDLVLDQATIDALDDTHVPYEDTGGGWICYCGQRETRNGPGFVRHVLTEGLPL